MHGVKSGWFIMRRPQVDTHPLPSQLRKRPRFNSRVGSLLPNMGHRAIETASLLLPIRLYLYSAAQPHSAIAVSSSNQRKLRERERDCLRRPNEQRTCLTADPRIRQPPSPLTAWCLSRTQLLPKTNTTNLQIKPINPSSSPKPFNS